VYATTTRRFIYTDKVGAGPEHPNKKWGLFSKELGPEDASARYSLDAARREDWFGVVLIEGEQERPTAYLQMCPRANGVELHKLDQFGSVIVYSARRSGLDNTVMNLDDASLFRVRIEECVPVAELGNLKPVRAHIDTTEFSGLHIRWPIEAVGLDSILLRISVRTELHADMPDRRRPAEEAVIVGINVRSHAPRKMRFSSPV
jgi:hypothetical protein